MRRAAVVAALLALIAPVAPSRAASAGAIQGQVNVAGAPSAARKIKVTIDQYVCGNEKNAQDVLVGPAGGLQNVVVWLENPPPGRPAGPAPAPVQMDQKECAFVPRVVIVPAGGTVDFLNSDRLLHNLHAAPSVNPPFNRTQPKGRTIPITFAKPEIIRIDCDLHSWMRGWVVVATHPYYALTDANGAFAFKDLPAGSYTLRLWHERAGTTTRNVTVAPDTPTKLTIDLRIP
jgi:plastocyanin